MVWYVVINRKKGKNAANHHQTLENGISHKILSHRAKNCDAYYSMIISSRQKDEQASYLITDEAKHHKAAGAENHLFCGLREGTNQLVDVLTTSPCAGSP